MRPDKKTATGGNKNNMDMQWRSLFATIVATIMIAAPARAGEPVDSTPAWPAALAECNGCRDTRDADHDITFISRLSFPLGSARLTRDAAHEMLRMLVELEAYGVIKHVEIIGHADPSGPEEYNRWISAKRASRVQDYFAQSGVDPRRMSIRGAGSAEPLPGAIDPSEHRRTEVRITVQPFLR